MDHIRYTLLADGSSDAVLMPVIDWLFSEHVPHLKVTGTFARDLNITERGLQSRINAATRNYPCDVLFVHRDCETALLADRLAEITSVSRNLTNAIVPVVPCRMTEAWLFSDEQAIRFAAGNQSGRVRLVIPTKRRWDSLPDPKEELLRLLCDASEKSGRALKKFRPESARHIVAQRTESFAGLRGVAAFDEFEQAFLHFLRRL